MIDDLDRKRLYWHSRRGMLELDLILAPFLQERFDSLEPVDQARYERLLTAEDQDLFKWFIGRERPADPDMAVIVSKILEYARTPKD